MKSSDQAPVQSPVQAPVQSSTQVPVQASPEAPTPSSAQRFWTPTLARLTPYVPGEQPRIEGLVKLNTNENPYPPSEAALEAMRSAIGPAMRLYPDPAATTLKSSIARLYRISAEQVFVGNGSDEVLAFIFQALLSREGGCAFPEISYSFYPVFCQLYGIEALSFPLDADFRVPLERVAAGASSLIVPNPNAPTGLALPADAFAAFARSRPSTLVVVDEAYVDFGAESCVRLLDQFDHLMVVQTLSKSRALAGLRVGFALGPPALIEALERVKNSFNSYTLDRIAIEGAVAAIEDHAWFEQNRARVMASRARLHNALGDCGMQVLPSQANFLFARHPRIAGAELAAGLRERRILVRHFARPGIQDFLRITVGTEEQCAALLAALTGILRELPERSPA